MHVSLVCLKNAGAAFFVCDMGIAFGNVAAVDTDTLNCDIIMDGISRRVDLGLVLSPAAIVVIRP